MKATALAYPAEAWFCLVGLVSRHLPGVALMQAGGGAEPGFFIPGQFVTVVFDVDVGL
jgi:hypothetical protein